MHKVTQYARQLQDSHPYLPLDPDSDRFRITGRIHTDPAHVAVVGTGAFFGTLARYELGLWIPAGRDGWPTAVLAINVAGAFLLGLLLQGLLHRGKDEGGRRVLRLMVGTGFLGAFTTYSSLATGVALFMQSGQMVVAAAYAGASVVLGGLATVLGIQLVSRGRGGRR